MIIQQDISLWLVASRNMCRFSSLLHNSNNLKEELQGTGLTGVITTEQEIKFQFLAWTVVGQSFALTGAITRKIQGVWPMATALYSPEWALDCLRKGWAHSGGPMMSNGKGNWEIRHIFLWAEGYRDLGQRTWNSGTENGNQVHKELKEEKRGGHTHLVKVRTGLNLRPKQSEAFFSDLNIFD